MAQFCTLAVAIAVAAAAAVSTGTVVFDAVEAVAVKVGFFKTRVSQQKIG